MPYKDLGKRKEYNRRWRAEHPEQQKEISRRAEEHRKLDESYKAKKAFRDHKRRTTEEYRKKHAEYERRWRASHPEEAKLKSKMAHIRRCLRYSKDYLCKERLEDQRRWCRNNRERKRQQQRQWYENNKEQAKAMYNAAGHRRRARLNGLASENFSIVESVVER